MDKNSDTMNADWGNKGDFDSEFWEDYLLYYYDDQRPKIYDLEDQEDEGTKLDDYLVCVRVSDSKEKFEVEIFESEEYDDIDFDWIEIKSSLSFEIAAQIKKRLLYYLTALPKGKNYDVETVFKTLANIADISELQPICTPLSIEELVKNYYLTKTILRLAGVLHQASVSGLKLELNNDEIFKNGIKNDWGLNYVSRVQNKFNLQRFKEENPDLYKEYCEPIERDFLLPIKDVKKEINLDVEEIEKISNLVFERLRISTEA